MSFIKHFSPQFSLASVRQFSPLLYPPCSKAKPYNLFCQTLDVESPNQLYQMQNVSKSFTRRQDTLPEAPTRGSPIERISPGVGKRRAPPLRQFKSQRYPWHDSEYCRLEMLPRPGFPRVSLAHQGFAILGIGLFEQKPLPALSSHQKSDDGPSPIKHFVNKRLVRRPL